MRQFSITILLVICFANLLYAQCKDEDCGLVIRGKVTNLESDRTDKTFVRFKVKLDVEFSNEGNQPLILFTNEFADGYWLGGWSIFEKKDDEKPIFWDGQWQSVAGGEIYRRMAEKLDVKTPPNELVKILQPKESWKFSDDFQITFEAEKHYSYPERKTWKEMQNFPSQLWLRIVYELSPWNTEKFKPNLIRKLQKRWKKFGNVLVETKKEGTFNHFRYGSEPMLIDFSQAKEKSKELK